MRAPGELSAGHDGHRVAGLDLLRGLAALSVALPHFFAYRGAFPDAAETISALAVEVFFVLSGYVLAPQILFCLGAGRPRHLGVFLVRRWMRTIPPYLVALLLISILSRQLGGADFLRYLCYAQNLFRQSNTTDYFAIAWSLSVEEWFYVTFPSLLLAAAWLFGRRDRRFAVVFGIGFCIAIAIARTLFGDLGDWGAAVRRVVAFRLDSIGYGFLLYVAVDRAGSARLSRMPGWAIALIAVVATVCAYVVLDRITETGNPAGEQLFPFAAAIFGAAAILCAVRAEGTIQRLRALAWLGRYLGRVSYSTYLFHVILIELIGATLPHASAVVQLALFLPALFGFTTLFYVYFERPILAARPHYRSRRPPALDPLTAVAPADRR
ncbi:MAG TPA: acyltransferase [Stellaceae bacterium]|nr:acyltransferase [Stellaceae bacterium]